MRSNLYFLILIFVINLSCSESTKKGTNKMLNYVEIADQYYENDNYKDAKKNYELALKQNIKDNKIYYRLGVCYGKLSSFEESNNFYLKAIDNNYRKGDAYFNMGLNQICQLDYSSALIYLKKALELLPDDDDIIDEIKECEEILNDKKLEI